MRWSRSVAVFWIVAITAVSMGQAGSSETVAPKKVAKPASAPLVVVEPPLPLPGKGLAQHDFIFTGEFDTRKPMATISLIQGGKRTWMYQIPTKDETNGQLSEFSDLHRLSNGDIVFAYKTGWRKIDKDGKIVWEYKNGDTPGIQLFGVHQAIRLVNGNTVLTNWCPGRLGSRKAEWPKTIQLVEVTPDKKVVWVLREWTDPDLGTSSCAQMLDEPSDDEDQDLMR